MKKVLITGSIAYDHIMTFDGEFEESFLPASLKSLSVSFIANSHLINFGGCAPNIAYSFNLLGDKACIYGVAGNDFKDYKTWLEKKNILTDFIEIDENQPTAAAYILTDKIQNQITIFSPGAMANIGLKTRFSGVDFSKFDMVVISPGEPHRMLYLAQHCIEKDIPFVFDPGQGITALSREALMTIIENAKGVIANAYECDLLEKKLGYTFPDLAKKMDFLIRTQGENGCKLFVKEKVKLVPSIQALNIIDSTGCGDGFRAGFLSEYLNGNSLERSCEVGHTVASFILEEQGSQNHHFSEEELMKRLILNYGEEA